MREKPLSCLGCPLHGHGSDFSLPEGLGKNGVMVVAEASGEMEARDGLPLRPYAPAGSVYERTLRRLNLDRNQFVTTNMLRCRPAKNLLDGMPYETSAIRHCTENLLEVYRVRNPKVILALGNIPFRHLTGMDGKGLGVTHQRGYVFPVSPGYSSELATDADLRGVVVVPTYHPSHIRRGASELIGVFAWDIQRAVNIAKGLDLGFILGDPLMAWVREELDYTLETDFCEAEAFYSKCAQEDTPISYDLETYESASLDEDQREQFSDTRIKLIQFSRGEGQAIVMPWNETFRPIARAILKLPNMKFGHNAMEFDNRVLRAAGEREGDWNMYLPSGPVMDTLQMWRRWQPDLPGGLQYVSSFVRFPFPWKHLNESHPRFYAATDADAGRRVGMMLLESMGKMGISDAYEVQVAGIHDVPARVAARGVRLSRVALDEEIIRVSFNQNHLMVEMNNLYPQYLLSVSPSEGYKVIPKEVKNAIAAWHNESLGILIGEHDVRVGENELEYVTRFTGLEYREFEVKEKRYDTGTKRVMRWCRPSTFNPASRQQILAYSAQKKHDVPKKSKDDGSKSESLSLGDIEYLYAKTKDKFYLHVARWRRLTEERKDLLDLIRGQDGDVVLHPYWVIDPKGGVKAKGISWPDSATKAMVAKEGNVLVRLQVKDLAVQIAWERSGEKRCDEELPESMRWFLDGLSDMAILDANRLTLGTSLKTVQVAREQFIRAFPALARWQQQVAKEAHQNQILVNRFGELKRFYEVFVPDRKGGWTSGPQFSDAVRFLPESEASGWMRERLGILEEEGLIGRLVMISRDELVFEVEAASLDDFLTRVKGIIMQPGKLPFAPLIECEVVGEKEGVWA